MQITSCCVADFSPCVSAHLFLFLLLRDSFDPNAGWYPKHKRRSLCRKTTQRKFHANGFGSCFIFVFFASRRFQKIKIGLSCSRLSHLACTKTASLFSPPLILFFFVLQRQHHVNNLGDVISLYAPPPTKSPFVLVAHAEIFNFAFADAFFGSSFANFVRDQNYSMLYASSKTVLF